MTNPSTENTTQNQEIGSLLLNKNLINKSDLKKARSIHQEIGGYLYNILIRIGAISEDSLLPVLSQQLQIPVLAKQDHPHDFTKINQWLMKQNIDLGWWIDHKAIAWQEKDKINCIVNDYLDNNISEIIEKKFSDKQLQWFMVNSHDLEHMLNRLEKTMHSEDDPKQESNLRELAEEAPVIEMVNNFISQAVEHAASDIHIEPYKDRFEVRYRVDGVLLKQFTYPIARYDAVSSRIKIISKLDIAEKRLPQDGRIRTKASGTEFDIRISTLPGVFGESVVMRLLMSEKQQLSFKKLGLSNAQQQQLKKYIRQPHGIVLVTGPTGSGKSTTLYTALESIIDGTKKIITVEDPVEYQIDGITQVQTIDEIGYSFATALRSVLRQDPDVIMIGEIRDLETAEIAIQSSLTGHMVLSTLHTNNAVGAFNRLIDMGVEPFLVATPIEAVIAQRLVRKVCTQCAEQNTQVLAEIKHIISTLIEDKKLPATDSQWKTAGAGCPHCNGTGYKGRIGIYEMVTVSQKIRHLIIQQASTDALWQQAEAEGSISLRTDGFIKAWQGITTIEEVLRSTSK